MNGIRLVSFMYTIFCVYELNRSSLGYGYGTRNSPMVNVYHTHMVTYCRLRSFLAFFWWHISYNYLRQFIEMKPSMCDTHCGFSGLEHQITPNGQWVIRVRERGRKREKERWRERQQWNLFNCNFAEKNRNSRWPEFLSDLIRHSTVSMFHIHAIK